MSETPTESVDPFAAVAASISGDPVSHLLHERALSPPIRPGLLGHLDRYEIIEMLGEGGMGVVLLARDPATSARVAIKLLKPALTCNTDLIHRFRTEATHMQGLSHPNILKILEVPERPGCPYVVLPYMQRGSLARRIREAGALDSATTMRIAKQIAEALTFAHKKGIIHRDLKPANVLLGDGGEAHLADFGLGRTTVVNESIIDVRRQSVEGTPAYMAPEIAAGEAGDFRRDIYAFGALLYEMLTGRPPYSGATAQEVIQKVQAGPPEAILEVNPKASAALARIAEGAMARELRDRYAHMADVLADLERVNQGKEPLGPHGQPGPGSQLLRRIGLQPTFRTQVVALIGMVCILSVLLAYYVGRTRFPDTFGTSGLQQGNDNQTPKTEPEMIPTSSRPNAWLEKSRFPSAVPRDMPGVAVLDGKIYIVGGSAGGPLNTVDLYDPGKNVWETRAPMPTARYALGLVECKGKLYALGGRLAQNTAQTSCTGIVEQYDPATDTWTELAPLSQARQELAAVSTDGRIYAIGGDVSGASTWANEEFDPSRNSWTTKAHIPIELQTRSAAAAFQGRIFLFGGFEKGGKPSNRVFIYNPAQDAWIDGSPMRAPQSRHGVCELSSKIYVAGGRQGPNASLNSVLAYDPLLEQWDAPLPDLPERRENGDLVAVGGRLYWVDGSKGTIHESTPRTTPSLSDVWRTEPLDEGDYVGEWTGIGVDSADRLHISTYKSRHLFYLTNAGGSWQKTTVDTRRDEQGRDSRLVVDKADKIHIVYTLGRERQHSQDLAYATNAVGAWQCETIDRNTGKSGLAVDSAGHAHIAYVGHADPQRTVLKYATNSGGSWRLSTVGTPAGVGEAVSLCLDSSDKLHIAYCDGTTGALQYTTNRTGSWQVFPVDREGNVGQDASIACEPHGHVHISYYDTRKADLKYATDSSRQWQCYLVDEVGDVGGWNSLILDKDGGVRITYYDGSRSRLKHAAKSNGSRDWSFAVLSSADRGFFPSSAIDSKGHIHIAHDRGIGMLGHTTNAPQ